MRELTLLLKKHFGFDTFRPLQEEVVRRVIDKKDSLVLMPTGGGKSICYQLPALYLKGTAIVVSPLIALMKDQVKGLTFNGVPAAALNSMMPEAARQALRQECIEGRYKLLYISPEGLLNELDGLLKRMELSLIAIDEAHCISRWGHDFRPEYARLSVVKDYFPGLPVIALTATADKITRLDIAAQLKLNDPQLFISSFDRPNLSLTVHRGYRKKEKMAAIVAFIRRRKGESGILYCMKRADTEAIAERLRSLDISASAYHAGLLPAEREKAQDDFINDRIDVVCATIAFGMGIDKSNVRWVIHYNMPGNIENYYQEIGRAGRDGLPGDTVLFYSLGDLVILRRFAADSGQDDVNVEKLNRMQLYCQTAICRRRVLLNYFGEEADHDCGNCDICRNPPPQFDGTILVQKALSAILRTDEKVGVSMLIDILRASGRASLHQLGYDKLKTYGAGRDLPFRAWQDYIEQMLQLGYAELDYMNDRTLKVTPLGRKVLFGEAKAILANYHEEASANDPATHAPKKEKKAPRFTPHTPPSPRPSSPSRSKNPIRIIETSSIHDTLMNSLRQLRLKIAKREGVPAYIVFSDDTLHEMAHKKPITREDFAGIRGVGDVKLNKYGEVFVALIRHILKV
ncbi:MAG: DNA helicase RecQ [Tannerellaceae bacterium]|jgi:ATP-dependent DNA helicase RecQ|nr:DNA helicase RecQ [Tannerellaceae bacterium]